MKNDLEKQRKSAIENITKRLIEAYEICRDQDEIDWLSYNYGLVTGQLLRRRMKHNKKRD